MRLINAVRAPARILLFSLMTAVAMPLTANEFNLPSLGDTSSSIMSREQEYQLGRAWLSMLRGSRSEEHTSELQSRPHLVCRLLLEKKNIHIANTFFLAACA